VCCCNSLGRGWRCLAHCVHLWSKATRYIYITLQKILLECAVVPVLDRVTVSRTRVAVRCSVWQCVALCVLCCSRGRRAQYRVAVHCRVLQWVAQCVALCCSQGRRPQHRIAVRCALCCSGLHSVLHFVAVRAGELNIQLQRVAGYCSGLHSVLQSGQESSTWRCSVELHANPMSLHANPVSLPAYLFWGFLIWFCVSGIYICIYMYIYIHIHMYIYIYVCKSIYIYMNMYVYILFWGGSDLMLIGSGIYIYRNINMYIHTYICIYIYTCIHICMNIYVCIYIFFFAGVLIWCSLFQGYTYIEIYICVHIHIYIYIYMYVYMHIHIYMYIFILFWGVSDLMLLVSGIYIYIYIYLYIYIYVCVYIYMYIYIYIYWVSDLMLLVSGIYTYNTYICIYICIYVVARATMRCFITPPFPLCGRVMQGCAHRNNVSRRTRCITLQYTAPPCWALLPWLQHTATHCATHCNTLCNTLCNILQHATSCVTRRRDMHCRTPLCVWIWRAVISQSTCASCSGQLYIYIFQAYRRLLPNLLAKNSHMRHDS